MRCIKTNSYGARNRSGATINSTTYVYNVNDGDKLNSITVGGTTVKSYGYDAAGRTTSIVTSAGTTTLAYDYEDRITGITYPSTATNSFTYNGLDTRVSKTDSGGTATYLRDGVGVLSHVLSDGTAAYTPGVSQNRSTTTTYDLNDFLGSATRQTGTSASTTATRAYDAWGNLLSSTGTPLGPFGFVGAKGYTEDGDSGLKLLGHRYYDPSTGRFLTRDHAMAGRNWYGYCENNPLKATDQSGLDENVIGIIMRAIAGGRLPPGTGGLYKKNGKWRGFIHRRIGERKQGGGNRGGGRGGKQPVKNPDLPDEEVEDIVRQNLPPELSGGGAPEGGGGLNWSPPEIPPGVVLGGVIVIIIVIVVAPETAPALIPLVAG